MLSSFSDTFFDIYRLSGIAGKIHSISTLLSGEILEFSPNHGYIHIIQKEKCLLTMNDLEHHLELKHCDIAVVLPGNFHSISLSTDAFQDAKIITCTIDFSGIYGSAIAEGLPAFIHVPFTCKATNIIAEWVPITVHAIQQELKAPSIGSQIMLTRIIDLLFIWSIRCWLSTVEPNHKSWISALQEPMISKAMSLMHNHPHFDWTVEELAKSTNYSKSSFYKKFTESVGTTPIQYLKSLRMRLASELLLTTQKSIFHIAELVGYSSQAAFSRVFSQTFNYSPSEFRESFKNNPAQE